jgi:hypothetical protein
MRDLTPAPTPAPTAAPRKPREVHVHKVTVRQRDGESLVRLVQGSAAQAREHVSADTITVERATPQEIISHGRAGVDIEQAAGGEGGAA